MSTATAAPPPCHPASQLRDRKDKYPHASCSPIRPAGSLVASALLYSFPCTKLNVSNRTEAARCSACDCRHTCNTEDREM